MTLDYPDRILDLAGPVEALLERSGHSQPAILRAEFLALAQAIRRDEARRIADPLYTPTLSELLSESS